MHAPIVPGDLAGDVLGNAPGPSLGLNAALATLHGMREEKSGMVLTNVATFCKNNGQRAGSAPVADLKRLATSLVAASDGVASWAVDGSTRTKLGAAPELWLTLHARAVVPLQCQRCLAPAATTLAVDRDVLLVSGEDVAARLDEELDDDVLALPERLNLLELLEDELILALPLVPRHDGECPVPLGGVSIGHNEETGGRASTERVNPFAVLAALKGRPTS